MNRTVPLLLAVAALAVACDRTPEPRTSSPDPSATASAPPAPSLAATPADMTKPSTHDVQLVPPMSGEPTARDTKANDPAGTLTSKEESTAMPMAGQGNNHSSPSLEKGKPAS